MSRSTTTALVEAVARGSGRGRPRPARIEFDIIADGRRGQEDNSTRSARAVFDMLRNYAGVNGLKVTDLRVRFTGASSRVTIADVKRWADAEDADDRVNPPMRVWPSQPTMPRDDTDDEDDEDDEDD